LAQTTEARNEELGYSAEFPSQNVDIGPHFPARDNSAQQ
jgi:hypothetical protein